MNDIFKEISQEKLELYFKVNKWHRYQDKYQRTSWKFGDIDSMKTVSAIVPLDRKMTVEEISQAIIKIAEAEDRHIWVVAGNVYELEESPIRQIRTNEELLKKIIPHGDYCYDSNGCCPFWDKWEMMGEQNNGYCMYLQAGDFTDKGTSLLWDQIKSCGINNQMEDKTE